jgi:acetyltransferase-like isoleucine patch superfamily enzyme
MSRLHDIFQRYGWRSAFVVAAIGTARADKVRHELVLGWLRLNTKGRKGSGTRIGRSVTFTPGSHVTLGNNLFIGARCSFEAAVNPPASIEVGANTWISHDCHITSYKHIQIGDNVLVGEFVSLRDSTHSYEDKRLPVSRQGDVYGSIVIEDDVWIGRGCLVQGKPDTVVIGRGAIIGANSVVTRSVPSMEVWGGVPARFIKHR